MRLHGCNLYIQFSVQLFLKIECFFPNHAVVGAVLRTRLRPSHTWKTSKNKLSCAPSQRRERDTEGTGREYKPALYIQVYYQCCAVLSKEERAAGWRMRTADAIRQHIRHIALAPKTVRIPADRNSGKPEASNDKKAKQTKPASPHRCRRTCGACTELCAAAESAAGNHLHWRLQRPRIQVHARIFSTWARACACCNARGGACPREVRLGCPFHSRTSR